MKLRGSISKYRVSIGILTFACIACGTLLTLSWVNTEKAISASEASRQAVQARTEAYLKELEAKKTAAEEQAAQDAEEAATTEQAEEDKAASSGFSSQTSPESCNTATTHINPASIDVLVNKKHCLIPLTFAPADLVTSNGATLSAKAIDAFNQMFAAAAAAGQPFTVSSSYRSYATQVSTYNYWVSVNGQQAADTVSARPGFSEHQTGLVMDVGAGGCNLNCFGGTSQYQWFQANAANYGFIQRYYAGFEAITGYASEEWHYRYVGVAVAQDMKAKGIKTLEQYWGLEGGDYH
jgi:D-alanyl-D-alanine carboxypeptidase